MSKKISAKEVRKQIMKLGRKLSGGENNAVRKKTAEGLQEIYEKIKEKG